MYMNLTFPYWYAAGFFFFFYLQEFRLPTVWFFILPDVTSEFLITSVFVIMLHAYDCLILHLPVGPDSCKWCVWQENEKDLSHN
jgi:hypothetical protein